MTKIKWENDEYMFDEDEIEQEGFDDEDEEYVKQTETPSDEEEELIDEDGSYEENYKY